MCTDAAMNVRRVIIDIQVRYDNLKLILIKNVHNFEVEENENEQRRNEKLFFLKIKYFYKQMGVKNRSK